VHLLRIGPGTLILGWGRPLRRLALLTLAALAALLVAAATAVAAYQFQTSWGTPGSGQGQFTNPGLPAVGPDGSVYLADTGNNRVQKFTSDGAFLLEWGATGVGQAQFNSPNAVAVGPDGTVYVTDGLNNRVQRFDANGAFLSQWGSTGAGDGQFSGPAGIAAGPDGSVYVADTNNTRVERFLADGTFLSSFTSGAGGFSAQVRGVAAGPDGSVYVADAGNSRIERFDANGVFQSAWGSNGAGDGQFQNPQGIAASAVGVYVADAAQNRVQKFSSTGTFLDSLDGAGSGDAQFAQPTGIAISNTGAIYVVHITSSRVARYSETGGANLPPPQTGQTANAEPAGGTVRVKVPGSNQFVLLTAAQQIPIGSIVDVTKGTVTLTTTASATTTQTATFFAGVFKLAQDKSAAPVTELQLFGGNFKKACGKSGRAVASAGKKKKVVRQLWGNGKGKFRTKGRYSSAAIRGTEWLTQDRCDGTLTRVKAGSVTVRDFVKKKNVIVNAPKTYLAKASDPRRR
jgi:sugar lactone lactonase YvrE